MPVPTSQENGDQEAVWICFPLSGDNRLELKIKTRVSLKDFDRIKDLIDLSKDSLVTVDTPVPKS